MTKSLSRIWRWELLRAALIWVAGAVVGGVFGHVLIGLLAATLLLLIECWVKLHAIEAWLSNMKGRGPSFTGGVWGDVLSRLYRWQRTTKKRKKRVRRAVSRFRSAIEATPDGAVILGRGDEVLWLNKPASTMLSLRSPDDIHRPITQIVRAPGFAEYLDLQRYDDPMEMVSPADENRRLLLRVVPYDRDRRLLLVRDVTRLHRLEEVRKSFVANVSHELRSPLTVVSGYLESMSDDPELAERWGRPIQLMSQQSDRMRLIVEDLLRLSQMESDPGGARHEPVRVAEMLENICRDARSLDEGAHELEIDADPELRVLGEHNELYSAFSNLVFNAVQYTPEGGSVTLVWARQSTDGKAGARLDVHDSGVGIEPHHISRLTERFYRVDKARSRELGGTGLGLAIVKHVLARHDARLEIASTPGEGSTFSCLFPAERTEYADMPGDDPAEMSTDLSEQSSAAGMEPTAQDPAQPATDLASDDAPTPGPEDGAGKRTGPLGPGVGENAA